MIHFMIMPGNEMVNLHDILFESTKNSNVYNTYFDFCLCSEFYEDILSIICTCTCFEISQFMWTVFYMLYEAFQRDAFDYFAGKYMYVF